MAPSPMQMQSISFCSPKSMAWPQIHLSVHSSHPFWHSFPASQRDSGRVWTWASRRCQPELAREHSLSSRKISRQWKTESRLLSMPIKTFLFWRNVIYAGLLLAWLWELGYDGLVENRRQHELMSLHVVCAANKLSWLGYQPGKELLLPTWTHLWLPQEPRWCCQLAF